jgi:DNA polymerase III delta prime subunit
MPHSLYIGVTQSGKTTLARACARDLSRRGHEGAVYDPVGTGTAGGGWPEGWPVFDDPDEFLAYATDPKNLRKHLFVDEAHEILGHDGRDNFWLLTKGRHFGLFLHVMSQRPNKLHPDVRTNCAICYMFRLAQDDAYEIGKDYGHSNIHKFSLDKGDFLVLESGSSAIARGNVFTLLKP